MGLYPKKDLGQEIQTDVGGDAEDQSYIMHQVWDDPAAADEDSTGLGSQETSETEVTTVTSGITQPDYPRNVEINPSDQGTVTDGAACNHTITGTDVNDEVITEEIALAADQVHDTVSSGTKAFKTITSISIPIQDGADAEYLYGYGDVLGLKVKRDVLPCIAAFLNETLEGTAPTITGSATELASNTIDLSTALDGNQVDAFLVV